MAKLSVAIITFNEEKNIARCLTSVQRVADEIVVIDSFSTDKTGEICAQFGARFIQNPFGGHVEQKNYAVSRCSNDLVLSLDADEALSPVLASAIEKVKESPDADGYYFNRATYFCGQHIRYCGWYPDPSLRLWNRRKGLWGGDNPHDKFMMQPGTTVRHLAGDMLHYSYYFIEEHIVQLNKFSSISARSKFLKGKKSNIMKITIFPTWRFFRDYVLKLGFLDGYYGFVICVNSAHEVFQKYTKLRDLWRNAAK
jgi:glycosyltransferase involved in cell wall biosynthesis